MKLISEPHYNYWENGQILSENWIDTNYGYHRLDGPAKQIWDYNGFLESKEWFQNNLRHRVDGPAFIYIDNECPEESLELWFLCGIELKIEHYIWMFENEIYAPYTENDVIAFKMRFVE